MSYPVFQLHPTKALSALALLLLLIPQPALGESSGKSSDAQWEEISNDDGITVWEQEIPGTSLVAFRGKGLINADLHAVFSVLYESEHKKELLYRCSEYEVLEVSSKVNFVIYNRISSPFILINDRDVVVKTDLVMNPKSKTIIANFRNTSHKNKPSVNGVVRMKHLEGIWMFKALDNGKTLVTYEVRADPGGWLPKWAVNIANRSLPTKTIEALRREVKREKVYAPSRELTVRFFDLAPFVGADHPAVLNRPKEPLTEAQTQALIEAVRQGKPLLLPASADAKPSETAEVQN